MKLFINKNKMSLIINICIEIHYYKYNGNDKIFFTNNDGKIRIM